MAFFNHTHTVSYKRSYMKSPTLLYQIHGNAIVLYKNAFIWNKHRFLHAARSSSNCCSEKSFACWRNKTMNSNLCSIVVSIEFKLCCLCFRCALNAFSSLSFSVSSSLSVLTDKFQVSVIKCFVKTSVSGSIWNIQKFSLSLHTSL